MAVLLICGGRFTQALSFAHGGSSVSDPLGIGVGADSSNRQRAANLPARTSAVSLIITCLVCICNAFPLGWRRVNPAKAHASKNQKASSAMVA
jgi:hypothetical protein